MNKKDLERRLEAAEKQMIGLQDEIQNLKTKLAETQDEPEIPDMPDFEDGETLWYMDNELDKVEDSNAMDGFDVDFNMFHTKEMAQEFADKCKLIAMMLHCKWYADRDGKTDFSKLTNKYNVWFSHDAGKWVIDWQMIHETPTVYFSTEEAAQKCADWLNEHWKESKDE